MRRSWMFLFVNLLTVGLLGAVPARAQGIYGSLRGEVLDPTGAAAPGAKIIVTNEETGVASETETTSVGTFFVPNLLAGRYTITVEKSGFRRLVRKGVQVQTNQVIEVSLTLQLGTVEQVVEVVAGAELVQTTTSDLANSWPSRTVTELPNFSATGVVSDPRNLAVLLPGVTSQPGGVSGEGGSIGGNRPRNNNFVLDGVDNNNIAVTGALQPVITEAVEEFTLRTNQFSAEFGHSTAGQFILTTKSGTNDLHGRAWWFTQNKDLDATDNLIAAAIQRGDIPEKPRRDFNRVGGQLGGPIQKDKWFLFGAFEYQVFGNSGIPSVQVFAPTQAGFAALSSIPGISRTNLAVLETFVPPAAASSDTARVGGIDIPVGPLAVAVEDRFRQYDWQLNMDYATPRHRFSGRFLFNRFRAPNTFEGIFPAFVGTLFSDNRSVQFSDVFTVSTQLINEFRLGYRRNSNGFSVPDVSPPGNLDAFPNILVDELNLNIGAEGGSPQAADQNIYQIVDQITYVRGSHTLKAGIDVRNIIAPANFLPRERGEYDWATLDSYLFDQIPDGANGALRGTGSGFFAGNQEAVFGFVQDDWRIHPRVTLNLGLRYEWVNIPRDAGLQELNSIADVPGVLEFRTPRSDTNNLAPRFGFAWDVFGDHKTAVRGGFSVAYDVLFQNFPITSLPPQLQSELN
ncbi:MAG: TonB-dependent receptor, partial [Acidobacteria bacterium]|nr:TonB-dependent receptor [Acidobacteriota bacterium]